jgi:hypothetical protein
MHSSHHDLRLTPGHDLDLGNQARLDGIGDEVRQPLLEIQRSLDSKDGARTILDADHEPAARGIGEGDQGPKRWGRRGEVTLELERLTLVLAQQVLEMHTAQYTAKRLFRSSFVVWCVASRCSPGAEPA